MTLSLAVSLERDSLLSISFLDARCPWWSMAWIYRPPGGDFSSVAECVCVAVAASAAEHFQRPLSPINELSELQRSLILRTHFAPGVRDKTKAEAAATAAGMQRPVTEIAILELRSQWR